MKKTILFLLILINSYLFSQIEVALSNSYITVGEWTVLSVTIKGDIKKIQHTEPDGVILQSYGQSSSYSFINGQKSKEVTLQYRVTPEKAGNLKLPVFSGIDSNKEIVESEELILYVEEGTQRTNAKELGNDNFATEHVKLYIDLPDREFYIGEAIPVGVRVYFLQKYTPKLKREPYIKSGSFILDLDKGNQNNSEYVSEGKRYYEVIWNGYLTPLTTGEQILQLHMDSAIEIPDGNTGFFTTYTTHNIETSTRSKKLNIKELPLEGKPENFSGAIGNFSINSELTSSNISVGDPTTLNIGVFGQGNFQRITSPVIEKGSENWKIYSPSSKYSGRNESKYHGVKTFSQILSPKNDKMDRIPSFILNYFDPIKKEYVTLSTEEHVINISPVQGYSIKTSEQSSMNFIAEEPSIIHKESKPVNDFKPKGKGTVILSILIVINLILALLLLLKSKILDNRTSDIDKMKKVTAKIIKEHIESNNYKNGLIEYNNLIKDYIAEKNNINPKSITSSDLKTNTAFYNISQKVEELTYSGGTISKDEFDSLTENILEEIK